MGVHYIVDIARESHGELCHRYEQGVSASGRRPLYVHRGTAGRLANTPSHIKTKFAHALQQTHSSRAFAFSKRGRCNSRNIYILAVSLLLETAYSFPQPLRSANPSS